MLKTTQLFAFLLVSLAPVACSSASDTGSGPPAGSVAEGKECTSSLDCAEVGGHSSKCMCTDKAKTPSCAVLSKAGESCAITGSFQIACETGTACTGGLSGAATCTAVAAQGKPCGGDRGSCVEGLTCTGGTCAPGIGKAGADCFNDGECAADLRCDFMKGCVARIALGASCKVSGIPTKRTCVDGAACDSMGKICVALKEDGSDCFQDAECATGECNLGGCGADYRIPSTTTYGCGF